MKTCIYCGAENEDGQRYCEVCGGVLPNPEPENKGRKGRKNPNYPHKKPGGKGLWIALITATVLLAAAAVAVSAMKALPVMRAYGKTSELFQSKIMQESDIMQPLGRLEENLKLGNYTAQLEWSDGISWLETEYDFSHSAKELSGLVCYQFSGADERSLVNYYLDHKHLEFSLAEDSYNVYGFRFHDLEKKARSGIFKHLISENAIEGLGNDLFKHRDLRRTLREMTGLDVKKFLSSAEIRYINKSQMEIGGRSQTCKRYQVIWDMDALTEGLRREKGVLAGWIGKLLSRLDPECVCFVNQNHQLTGFDCMFGGKQYIFLLEGQENPWDSFYVTEKTTAGISTCYQGCIDREGTVSRIQVAYGEDVLFCVTYDNANGDIHIESRDSGTILDGCIRLNADAVDLEMDLYAGSSLPTSICFSISRQKNKPEILADNYRDLMKLRLPDLERLLMDMHISLS